MVDGKQAAGLRLCLLTGTLALAGCGAQGGQVLPAVFGLGDAGTLNFRMGEIPEPAPAPGDAVVGRATNQQGQCIWRRANTNNRFRADCPEGYDL